MSSKKAIPAAPASIEFLDDKDVLLDEDGTEDAEFVPDAEYYANAKGFDIIFQRSGDSERDDGRIVRGKLVEWSDPEHFVVVAIDKGILIKKEVSAKEIFALNPTLQKDIDVARIFTPERVPRISGPFIAIRERLTSVLGDHNKKTLLTPHIDDGGNAETLGVALRVFKLPGGIEGCAATCIGGYRYEKERAMDGQETTKNRNEDLWRVNPQTGSVMVVDAMGGGKNGVAVADVVMSALADNEENIPQGVEQAKATLKSRGMDKTDGACFLASTIEPGKPLVYDQSGDVEIHHFGNDGNVKHQPGDQLKMGKAPQSALEFLEVLATKKMDKTVLHSQINRLAQAAYKEMGEPEREVAVNLILGRILRGQRPFVLKSNPLFTELRKMVVSAITSNSDSFVHVKTPNTVEAGDWVLILSDGVADNLKDGELAELVQAAISQNWSAERLTEIISEIIDHRIKLKASHAPEAEREKYKLDNPTIACMRVKGDTTLKKPSIETLAA